MNSVLLAYMVAPHILGLRFETGRLVERGRTETYVAEPHDRVDGNGVISRNGAPFGMQIATPEGVPMVQRFDLFAPSPEASFFTGSADGLFGARLGFLNGPPAADRPASYRITVTEGDTTLGRLEPEAVWRKSKIVQTARTGFWQSEPVVQHEVFLELDRPLVEGTGYRVALDHPTIEAVTFTYDTAELRSEAVHVSQIGFRPDDPHKSGYLSMWLGRNTADPEADPAVAYAVGTPFRLLDTTTGAVVFESAAAMDEPREAPSNHSLNFNLTDVLALDFSDFDRPGEYVIEVEGIGTSFPFRIDENVWLDTFTTAMQGIYHQRSGVALEPAFTDWPRPRSLHPDDGIVVRQSNATLMDTDQGLDLLRERGFAALVRQATDEVVEDAWGGWHDAGDWDRRVQHLEAARELFDLAELRPAFAAATGLRLPEHGNAIPDIIDEALWGVDFYRRLQKPDGGVPGGIEGNAYPPFGETSWTSSQPFFVYAPDAWSSFEYAATAARAALLVRPYDPARAAGYEESALRAMRWAEANTPDRAADHARVINARNLAAAELYRLTGDEGWHAVFRKTSSYAEPRQLGYEEHQLWSTFVYARTEHPIDEAILARGMQSLTGYADFLLGEGTRGGFGQLMNPWINYGWVHTSAIPGDVHVLISAHALTGDERYFTALVREAQFGLGANPDNMVYTTGMGHRSPRELHHIDQHGTGSMPDGITIFGGWNPKDLGRPDTFDAAAPHMVPHYPDQWPVHETYVGFAPLHQITEYTVSSVLSRVAKTWGYIAASDAAGPRSLVAPGETAHERAAVDPPVPSSGNDAFASAPPVVLE